MTAKFRSNLMSLTTLAVLIVNALWAAPVLADDGPPPTETPLETPTTPTEEPTPIAEQLQELPEGTEVIVLNEEGEVLPLASNETAQVIHNNDPMWCPLGVAPGGAGCTTPGQTSFNGLLTELGTYNSGAGPNKAGVIWIAGGYDSGTDDALFTSFTLDGLTLTEMAKYALTFQGGWIGTMGSKVTDQLDPSEFNASLSILDWKGALTLNDILIDGATVNPNTGTSATSGLIVETTGAITLNRIQVINSGAGLNGADLNNQISTTLAPITVNESIFNNNGLDGLRAFSFGSISIRNLTANGNGVDDAGFEYGAFITNWAGPLSSLNKPVTLSGMNQFKGNLGSGLFVSSNGAVTLNNITAYANDDITDDDVGDGTGVIVNSSRSLRMTGTNLITYNQANGLDLSSNGAISLNNVNASNNGLDGLTGNGAGAVLDNCLNPGLNTACSFVGQAVTLTGTNIFNNNGYEGLVVQSGGNITISNITASGNGSFGAYLDNCVTNGTTCNNVPRTISITTPATFLDNANDGLHIVSSGAITLKGLTANSNNAEGVYIDNRGSLSKPQNVTLSGTNVMNGNADTGLRILSYGSVMLANITANDNGQAASEYGVSVDNRAFSTVPNPDGSILITRKPVTFTGNNTFNNNFSGGLYLWSVGDVTLSNITATGNGLTSAGDGVHIENEVAWYPNGTSQSAYAAKVTLNGFGIFQGNGDEGLQIFSRGAIKLNNVTASDNLDVGLWANNAYITTMAIRQSITLTGINTFNNNDGGGTMLYSFGNVALSKVTAVGNTGTGGTGVGDGVFVQNNQAWSPNSVLTTYAANVTISGFGYFEGNSEDGLDILSKGTITLAAITANGNTDDGVSVVNTGSDVTAQNVTISGMNNFYDNGGDGLFVQTDGKITASNLTAIDNTGYGALLDNFTYKKTDKFLGITLTGVNSFQGNQGSYAAYFTSDGSITMTNINVDNNASNGLLVTVTKNITLTCGNAFSNGGIGLWLTSTSGGVMTLKGVHADNNVTDETLSSGSLIRTWNCP